MQRRLFSLFIVAGSTLALVLPGRASAQALTSHYKFIDAEQHLDVFGLHMNPSHGRLGAGPNAGDGAGIRWGVGITGPLALDLEASYSKLTRPVVDTAFNADSSHVVKGAADMNMVMTMANIRFNFTGPRTWHNIQPFALFGAGLAIDLSGENRGDTLVARDVRFGFGTSFAGNVGAGFDYFVTPKVAVRGDAGIVLWKLKAPNAFIVKGPGVVPASEWERNFKMSAGITWHY